MEWSSSDSNSLSSEVKKFLTSGVKSFCSLKFDRIL
jgi:hypothetical protein